MQAVRRNRSIRNALMLMGGVATAFVASSAARADARMPLASHRAVYDLSLVSAKGDDAPASARGRMVFEFNGSSCEGYSVNFRYLTEMQSSEGQTILSDMRSATFEDGDAKTLDFKIETDNHGRGGGGLVDGHAVKSGDGALSLDLRSPKLTKVDLDEDVAFPTEQIARLIDAAKDGKHIAEMKVFDGSDNGEKIFSTLSVIGKLATTPSPEKSDVVAPIATMQRWPVVVSYFDNSKKKDTPEYILSFDLYENGVSGAMRLDYGTFVLKGVMTSLELLPSRECAK